MFSIVKVLYDIDPRNLRKSLIAMACCSIVSWIRTFFMTPTETMPHKLAKGYDLRKRREKKLSNHLLAIFVKHID